MLSLRTNSYVRVEVLVGSPRMMVSTYLPTSTPVEIAWCPGFRKSLRTHWRTGPKGQVLLLCQVMGQDDVDLL